MAPTNRTRSTAILFVFLVAVGTLAPTAAALAPDLTASGVGSFLVDANGLARGANVVSGIDETAGTLSAFAVTGLTGGAEATTVFDAVAVADFQQLRKIEGAGSSALTLVGNNAVLTAADASGGLLSIAASQATSATYSLPTGVAASHAGGLAGHAGTALTLTNGAGTELGTLVHIPADAGAAVSGQASGELSGTVPSPFTLASGEVRAALDAGDRVLFRGIAGHLRSVDAQTGISVLAADVRQHIDTVADLAAQGRLAADSVSEFHLGGIHDAVMTHHADVALTSGIVGQNALHSTLTGAQAAAGGATVVQHELDYEVLPVQQASDVAVYVNGHLVPSVASAGALAVRANQGLDAAYALTTGGRTHVLTSVSSQALERGAATIALVDVTDFSGTIPSAESHAIVSATSNVVGSFDALGDLDGFGAHAAGTTEAQTKFIGRFASGVITKQVSGATVVDYTDLETRTTVFDEVTVVGETLSGGERLTDAIVQVSGPSTTLTAHDDLYGTTMLHVDQLTGGRTAQEVGFQLADGVRAHLVTDQVARVEGPGGYVGWLIARDAAASVAASTGTSAAASGLALDGVTQAGPADVVATLSEGSSLLLLAQEIRTGYASMDTVARGISSGAIGGHVLAGTAGQAVTHLDADYFGSAAADLRVTRATRGAIDLNHQVGAAASGATSFLVDARGAALMSADPGELTVLVGGSPAVEMPRARDVLDAGFAAYHVDTSAAGTLMVLVNAAAAARAPGGVDVQILSERAAAARGDAAADLFGGFDARSDGTALGHFVQVQGDLAAGTLRDLTVTAPQGATVVFDAVRAGSGAFAAPVAAGPALTFANAESALTVVDQTSAVVRLAASSAQTASFVLASNVRAEAATDSVLLLSGPNGFLGALVVTDAAGRSVSGGTLALTQSGSTSTASAVAELEDGGQVLFRAFSGIETELDAAERVALANALAAGQIAGQVIVQAPADAGARLSERAGFGAASATGALHSAGSGLAVLQSATSFSSTMNVVSAATTRDVTVTLSSGLEAGKTVLVSLDAGLMPGLATGDVEILFNGLPIGAASSYADVLDATDDAGSAEYHIVTSTVSGASQVLVSVPHFSTQTVTIRSVAESDSDPFVWVAIGLALVVVGQTAWMVYRRRTA